MSIVDNFYKRTNEGEVQKKTVARVNENQQLSSALSLFNESVDSQKRTAENAGRQSDETVIQWEQRIREQGRSQRGQSSQHEPLYADQYRKADYESNERYVQEAAEIENRVSAGESHESTGIANDLPWTKGDSVTNVEDTYKEMGDMQVDNSMLQKAVSENVITHADAVKISKKGKVEGINSTMWTSKPRESEFE